MPAGSYLIYYDGTYYQIRTDGKIPGPGIVGDAATVNGHTIDSNVPPNAIFTDTTYEDATSSTHGLMSTDDKSKLDGIDQNANNYSLPNASSTLGGIIVGTNLNIDSSGILKATVDSSLNTSSTMPVQNKVIADWLNAYSDVLGAKNVLNVPDGTTTVNSLTLKKTKGTVVATGRSTSSLLSISLGTARLYAGKSYITSGFGPFRSYLKSTSSTYSINSGQSITIIPTTTADFTYSIDVMASSYNATFSPMIRPTGTDATFASFAPTNAWLNDKKVDKITGKGLSTNDYTTAEKTKLTNIELEANKTIVDDALDAESENPVQNKVIYGEIARLNQAIADLENALSALTGGETE